MEEDCCLKVDDPVNIQSTDNIHSNIDTCSEEHDYQNKDIGQEIEIQCEEIVTKFREELEDLPELLMIIKRLRKCFHKQQIKLKKLYRKLEEQKLKTKQPTECHDASTQTENLEPPPESLDVSKSASLWNVGQTGHEVSNQSLAEQVKQVAENAQQQTGFVYEETSGMYYDYNTGYYYNAELGLYYDGNSGSYYYYDDKSKTFQFHSQAKVAVQPSWRQPAETPKSQHVDETSNLQRLSQSTTPQPLEGNPNSQDLDPNLVSISPQKVIKRKGKIQKTEERKRVKKKEEGGEDEKLSGAESMEEGECSDSSGDESEASSSQELSENVEMVITEQEVAEAWPPCMRIIVEETGLDNLKVGSLSIITCTGGTLGREKEHAVHIPDINISKHHAKFTFDEAQGKYFIVDFGSRNGTYLNGERLSVALRESDPHEVSHGNILQLGSTKLLCHIHMGRETCKQCEPGLVQGTKEVTADKFSESRGKQFKKELKRLRRKFGLESSEPDMTAINKPGYEDRAQIRRNTVGSTDHNEKTQVASLEESIQPQNKGFKMLAKMGWTEGQALGKEGDGLREPVPLVGQHSKAGLGSGAASLHPPGGVVNPAAERKKTVWKRTQKRYLEITSPME